MNPYVGNTKQIRGCEKFARLEGKAAGMEFYRLRNGKGLEMEISLSRNGDISSLSYKGMNLSYLSPCGYVGPAYYDDKGDGFLKSFTAGFLTTCGLTTFGSPSCDEGEELPLHGNIGNEPTSQAFYEEKENEIVVKTLTRDERIFGRKLVLRRTIRLDLEENRFALEDTVSNEGDQPTPLMVLYHMNMGYPLLDEDSQFTCSYSSIQGRNEHASRYIDSAFHMEKPQAGYQERCYYFPQKERGHASIYQPKLNVGLAMNFDARELPCLTEWKMMGIRDYVLGIEPGTNFPDGRKEVRAQGKLQNLEPGESRTLHLEISIFEK